MYGAKQLPGAGIRKRKNLHFLRPNSNRAFYFRANAIWANNIVVTIQEDIRYPTGFSRHRHRTVCWLVLVVPTIDADLFRTDRLALMTEIRGFWWDPTDPLVFWRDPHQQVFASICNTSCAHQSYFQGGYANRGGGILLGPESIYIQRQPFRTVRESRRYEMNPDELPLGSPITINSME